MGHDKIPGNQANGNHIASLLQAHAWWAYVLITNEGADRMTLFSKEGNGNAHLQVGKE
jgi:hypothetical protein